LKVIGFKAPFRRRGLMKKVLEDAPLDVHDASIFADLNPEFDSHSVLVPPGVFRKGAKT